MKKHKNTIPGSGGGGLIQSLYAGEGGGYVSRSQGVETGSGGSMIKSNLSRPGTGGGEIILQISNVISFGDGQDSGFQGVF